MWPDWAIFCTLGNFSNPGTTIGLPKSPTFLRNFCKDVKIYHFSNEIIFGYFIEIREFFSGHTACILPFQTFHGRLSGRKPDSSKYNRLVGVLFYFVVPNQWIMLNVTFCHVFVVFAIMQYMKLAETYLYRILLNSLFLSYRLLLLCSIPSSPIFLSIAWDESRWSYTYGKQQENKCLWSSHLDH